MREVTAYASDDGRVYATAAEAAEADARLALKQLDLFKEDSINVMVKNASAIVAALATLAEHRQ
jgi:hypothetical protein